MHQPEHNIPWLRKHHIIFCFKLPYLETFIWKNEETRINIFGPYCNTEVRVQLPIVNSKHTQLVNKKSMFIFKHCNYTSNLAFDPLYVVVVVYLHTSQLTLFFFSLKFLDKLIYFPKDILNIEIISFFEIQTLRSL